MSDMNLTSCENCGVVLDRKNLDFPCIHVDGEIDHTKAEWDGRDFVAKVPCPVCKHYILSDE